MNRKELLKRYMVFILGLFFAGLGVSFIDHAELGLSPLYCVAGVLNSGLYGLNIWLWFLIWSALMLLMQIIILRRDFKPVQLLQIPASVLFLLFVQAGAFLASRFPVHTYGYRIICVIIGTAIVAFGITLTIVANVVFMASDGLVKTVSEYVPLSFGVLKVIFDLLCVGISALASMALFEGRIIGIREGSIVAAVVCGVLIRAFTNAIRDEINQILSS